MASNAVQPLRINKMTPTSSPSKLPRALAEIGSTEHRRNSPSYNQATRKMLVSNDPSPKEQSPVRALWGGRDMLPSARFGQEDSPERENVAPSKRSSIENLKKASRVANSPMFARETRDKYDPSSSPLLERPLTDRPLSDRIQQNPFSRYDSIRKENNPYRSPDKPTHHRNESRTDMIDAMQPGSPAGSPQKSSLTSNTRYGQHGLGVDASSSEEEAYAPTPRQSLHPRKSVTFQTAPPEINEYEPQTPEPSSVASGSREGSCDSDAFEDNSFDRASSAEQEDSFDDSLEDAHKTPVVLPGDWRHASPQTARADLANPMDDVFGGESPSPTASPSRLQRPTVGARSESLNSEGSVRPLPPIPGTPSGLNAAAQSPRAISVSKVDILHMRGADMSLEHRMDLLALQETTAAERRKSSLAGAQEEDDDMGDLPRFDSAPVISRESILKRVKADLRQDYNEDEHESLYSDGVINYSDLARLDPDTAIPSREASTNFDDVVIKQEENSVLDLDHVPMLSYDPAAFGEYESSVLHAPMVDEAEITDSGDGLGISGNEKFSTPMEEPPTAAAAYPKLELNKKPSFGFLGSFLGKTEYDFGLTDYTSDTSRLSELTPVAEGDRSGSALGATGDRASVASDIGDMSNNLKEEDIKQSAPITAPIVPERKATIKTGGKLKARPSGTTADLEALIFAQRDAMANEDMPDLPAEYRPGSQTSLDGASIWSDGSGSGASKNDSAVGTTEKVQLDLALSSSEAELGAGSLAQEMNRIMEGQKKGYLMRQNTKVVVASRRNFSNESAGQHTSDESTTGKPAAAKSLGPNSSLKPSAGFIETEPWNGKMRRKSGKAGSGRRSNIGVAPPMPGQESALSTLEEHSVLSEQDDEAERGRLFVKVVGVKDVDLPIPRNDRLFFQLTLDNGLHCVTTANLDLGRNAPVGQEFELVVQQDLDFQLTLTTNLPPPPKLAQPSSFASTSPSKRSPTKNVFSRLLSSPKKRAEAEKKAQADAEADERRRWEDTERQRLASRPTAWDKMRELVDGTTGSFARAYVGLKGFEEQCYGRQLVTDIPLYNEWAMEKDAQLVSSVRSKRSQGLGVGTRGGVVRRPPYQIGALEVQLLYVPRGKGLAEEDMPKSMSSAIREMKEAEAVKAVKHEGFLSQQGGDCPYWRRRFFRLSSTKLTAFHEHTMQPRATINLAKASKLIDDKSSLVTDPAPPAAADNAKASSKKRRKSAFAEEDEGYQFVEEGFRVRFANGETIDFYADSTAEKEKWMAALSQAVGRSATTGAVASKTAKWTDAILAHETRLATLAAANAKQTKITAGATSAAAAVVGAGGAPAINVCPPSSSSRPDLPDNAGNSDWTRSVPSSPVKSQVGSVVVRRAVVVNDKPAVPAKDVMSPGQWAASGSSTNAASVEGGSPPMSPRQGGRARKAVKSMIL